MRKWRDGEGGRDGERKDQSYILGDRGKDTKYNDVTHVRKNLAWCACLF
jgi:hypothetical protein